MAQEATTVYGDACRLLIEARDELGVKLSPISIIHRSISDVTWADSFTKLLVFNETQYDRILHVDSDSVILQHMDEFFLLPPAPLAMSRAYWLQPEQNRLVSHIMLVQSSHAEFARIQKGIDAAEPGDYDMEVINQLYGRSALIMPHRPYAIFSGEFRQESHECYLGNPDEIWDPVSVLNEAKLFTSLTF